MMPMHINELFPMDIVILNDKPYMFTNMRVDRESVPKGYFVYDVRESDGGAGDFCTAEDHVLVNHWGTIIGKNKLPMETVLGRKVYYCDPEEDGWFNSDYVEDLKDFRRALKEFFE